MDLYRVMTASLHKVEGKTKIDGADATYQQDAFTVELEPETQSAGTLKLVFTGERAKEAAQRYKPGAVFALPPLADAEQAKVAASRFASKDAAQERQPAKK